MTKARSTAMAMNFFESQDVARKKTGRLVVLFALAVIGIIVAVHLVVAGSLYYIGNMKGVLEDSDFNPLWNPKMLAMVAGGTLLVVGIASLTKIAQLRGGGSIIAESLGGRPLDMNAKDPIERRLLNVVEEMAIASGVPTPPVYMMDKEMGINAFAAGYAPGSAVIGVTRGCAERLSRDELQGVIAHEFSHILNGDMRLNIKLMGVLFGIVAIGTIGYFVLRSAFYGSVMGHRSSRDRGNPLPLLAIGVGLIVVGSIGTFFGNWIKAAVSRQREYLADASAVQFTRNPEGIGGALKKIGGFSTGSKISSPNAPEMSHMFFGQALTGGLSAMFATHPPLAERIGRIDPAWKGEFVKSEASPRETEDRRHLGVVSGLASGSSAPESAPPLRAASPGASAIESIGTPTMAHLEHARALLAQVPEALKQAMHETYGARAVIFAMLINTQPQARESQLSRLREHSDEGICELTEKLLTNVASLESELRLPIIDAAMPALRRMSPGQYERFRANVVELVKADAKLDLFEWCLQRIVLQHLDSNYGKSRPRRVHHYNLARLQDPLSQMLSTLAYVGNREKDAMRKAFEAGARQLGLPRLQMATPEAIRFDTLDAALDELDRVKPQLKRTIIMACAACIASDLEVTAMEAELFRAFGEALGCPVPPLLPGQSLS